MARQRIESAPEKLESNRDEVKRMLRDAVARAHDEGKQAVLEDMRVRLGLSDNVTWEEYHRAIDNMVALARKATATAGRPAVDHQAEWEASQVRPDEVTASWGEEKIVPLPEGPHRYSSVTIGCVYYKTKVRPGETPEQAFNRALRVVTAVGECARKAKLDSFRKLLAE